MRHRFSLLLLEASAVTALYTVVAIFATWPMARDPLSGFYGFGNDNLGGIWVFGWLHDAYVGPGSVSYSPELQAPYGLDVPDHAIQPMDRLLALLFGGFGQGLGTYNFQIFSSFVLAGVTMYVLAKYITGSRLASGVAGLIYTLSPFHLAQAMQYAGLASIQWLPLFLLALIVVLRTGRLRHAAYTGVAFAVVTATAYYHAWFAIWLALVLVGITAVRAAATRWREKGRVSRQDVKRFLWLALSRGFVAGAVSLVLVGPFLISSVRSGTEVSEDVVHPLAEAVRYSGHPWMLFVPPHDNPFLGPHTRDFVYRRLYDSPIYEQSLYLGYAALALAALAFWRRRDSSGGRIGFAVPLLVGGFVTGLVIMLGPYVPIDRDYWRLWTQVEATNHVPSLGLLMFELGPIFRFFSRAFVLVSLCLAALAAVGFFRLERRVGSRTSRAALAVIVGALIVLEFANAPPHVWFRADEPPWVGAVRLLPEDSSVVDYPIAVANSPRSLYYMFWQREHRRATFNPPVSDPAISQAGVIGPIDDPISGRALRRMGIDYVVVHTRLTSVTRPPYQPALPDDSMPRSAGALNPWLSRVMATSDAVIYRVRDTPRPVRGGVVRAGVGFGPPEPEAGTTARWLQASVGNLNVILAQSGLRTRVLLTMLSFAQTRNVEVRVDGRRISSISVPPEYRTVQVNLGALGAGRHTLTLRTDPGPQSIEETIGLEDPRSVSLRLREPARLTFASPPARRPDQH
jgi:hypothetical protein